MQYIAMISETSTTSFNSGHVAVTCVLKNRLPNENKRILVLVIARRMMMPIPYTSDFLRKYRLIGPISNQSQVNCAPIGYLKIHAGKKGAQLVPCCLLCLPGTQHTGAISSIHKSKRMRMAILSHVCRHHHEGNLVT